METVHSYLFDKKDGHDSPNGVWFKAEAGGETFFLKKFKQPKYPIEGISPEVYTAKRNECDEWLSSKKRLISALNELGNGTGNIISPRDIFRDNRCFYQATYWIDIQTDSLEQVKEYSEENKIMLLKTYAAALKKVHSQNIIHGDLKPDNVLIGKSSLGRPVAKLIDFDDSYFSKEAPSPDLTTVTDAYQSPELAAYKQGHIEYREKLTCASDVFASGIIFHQFWCGEMPKYRGCDSGRFIYEAVAAGEEIRLNSDIPSWLSNLILAMLEPFYNERPSMEEVHRAINEQRFERNVKPRVIDHSALDKVWACVPRDLSPYTDESSAVLLEVCDRVMKNRTSQNQATINSLAKILYDALKKLEKKGEKISIANYSTIDKIMGMLPSDFSSYTDVSSSRLKKVVDVINHNRTLTSQEEVDKLAKLLYGAVRGLEKKSATGASTMPSRKSNDSDTAYVPAVPLPNGYTKVDIISPEKVCVYTSSGTKMTLPMAAACSMGLVVKK